MGFLGPVKVNDMVELKDFQSISDGESDIIYTVSQVEQLKVGEQLLFELLTLSYDQRQMWISSQTDRPGGPICYRLYYMPFPQLNRREWLANDGQWLFLPPADLDNFREDELQLAPFPAVPELEELGQMKQIDYRLMGDPFYAEGQTEGENSVCPIMVAEYASSEKVLNPTMLLLERNWCNAEGQSYRSGGIISLLVGGEIAEDEIVHHPLTPQDQQQSRKSWWQRLRGDN